MSELESEIRGHGYGDKHIWEYLNTEQNPNRFDRSSLYQCKICDKHFRHYYHQIENIFEAMKDCHIAEYCNKEKE